MQNVTKQDGKYSEIGWDDFVYLCANPPEAPDAPGGTLVTVTPSHIQECIQDWWAEIWGTTEVINQFMGELVELLKVAELKELYLAVCKKWSQMIVEDFQINLGGTRYMPSEKHGLFVEACYGHSSQIMELMKSGLMELQKYRGGESLPSPRGSFRQASIFAPLEATPLTSRGRSTPSPMATCPASNSGSRPNPMTECDLVIMTASPYKEKTGTVGTRLSTKAEWPRSCARTSVTS
jgi:hypothetical protein